MKKYSLFPLLLLISSPLVAHPGHGLGVSDRGFLPLVFVVILVVACLYGYELYRRYANSARKDSPKD